MKKQESPGFSRGEHVKQIRWAHRTLKERIMNEEIIDEDQFDGTVGAAARVIEAELEGNPRMSGKQVLAILNELAADTPGLAVLADSKYGEGDLPLGLTIDGDGSLVSWQGVSYVRQADEPQAEVLAVADASYDKAIMVAALNAAADKVGERPLVSTTRGWLAKWLRKEANAIAESSD